MALNVGDAIYRNLPEQVAQNQTDIIEIGAYLNSNEYIKTYVDAIKDFIVENTDTNTTEIGNNVEIDGNLIVNGSSIVESLQVNDTFIVNGTTTFNDNVNIDGDLAVTGSPVITGDLAVTGAITARTLSQTQANYTQILTFTPTDTNATIDYQYSVVKVINGMAHIIVSIKLINESSGDLSNVGLNELDFSLPESVSKLIYDTNGVAGNLASGGNIPVRACPALRQQTGGLPSTNGIIVLYHTGINLFRLRITSTANVNTTYPSYIWAEMNIVAL